MGKALGLLITFVLLGVGFANADFTRFESGDFTYEVLFATEKKVKVCRTEGKEYAGHITIPAKVEYDGNTYIVEEYDTGLFEGCSDLEYVELPDNLIPFSDRMFKDCVSLDCLPLLAKTKHLGISCFEGCSFPDELVIPVNIRDIKYRAFAGSNFSRLEFEDNLIIPETTETKSSLSTNLLPSLFTLDSANFDGSEITELVYNKAKVPPYAFKNHTEIKKVVLGNNVTTIDEGAFYGCTSLSELIWGDKISTIGKMAFYGCTSLYELSFPNTITLMKERCFENCTNLRNIIFEDGDKPLSVELERSDVPYSRDSEYTPIFYGCINIKYCYLGRNINRTIFTNYFDERGSGHYYSFKCSCYKLKRLDIGPSVNKISEFFATNARQLYSIKNYSTNLSIGYNAFEGCYNLMYIEGTSGIVEIQDSAFQGCGQLQNYYYGSLTKLGPYAFADCNLTEFGFSGTIRDFKSYAYYPYDNSYECYFKGCHLEKISFYHGEEPLILPSKIFSFTEENEKDLKEIWCVSPNPPSFDKSAIDCFTDWQYMNTIVYVPQEDIETYQNHPVWCNFRNLLPMDMSSAEGIECSSDIFNINGKNISPEKDTDIYNANGLFILHIPAGNTTELPTSGLYILVSGKFSKRILVK